MLERRFHKISEEGTKMKQIKESLSMQPFVALKQESYKNPDFLVKIKNNSFIALFFFRGTSM